MGSGHRRRTVRDPIEVLLASNEGRLEELVPIRFGRMAVSPFTFLRGSAAVMTADLAAVPTTGLQVQACGDCHLMNFGLFATPERNVVFGLNDFDETMPGPWEWDLKRLVASFVVAARDVRLDDDQATEVAAAVVRAYRERMWEFAEMSPLEIWYDRIDLAKEIEGASDKAARKRRERLQEQARKRVAENLFPKLVTTDGGRMRIADQPPLIFHLPELTPEVALEFLDAYRDLAGRRSAGVVRPLSLRGRGDQDRRGGQRRHPLLRGAVHVRGRSSAAVAGEGGQQLGDGAVPRSPAQEGPQRQAGGRRSASHAAGQRHLPRLGERPDRSRLLRPPAPRHEGVDHAHRPIASSS